ncbi:MAG: hypothetical protein ACRCWG_05115 [Sarcina sp.]
MNKEEFEKICRQQCSKEIKELENLIKSGISYEELIKNENIDRSLLSICNVPSSYLNPRKEPQNLSSEDWDAHIPQSNFEFFDGVPFDSTGYSRDALLIALMTNVGLEHLVSLLPRESSDSLIELLSKNETSSKKNIQKEFDATVQRIIKANDLEELTDAREDLLDLNEKLENL